MTLHRLSLLYGCTGLTAAQLVAYCLGACMSRKSARARGAPTSPVLELEVSLDSMAMAEQQECQRALTPYAAQLSDARVRVVLAVGQDLQPAVAAAAASVDAGGGSEEPAALELGPLGVPLGAETAWVIGAEEAAQI
eukprot:36014-Chlamydomonas_euryale.AAC.1